MLQICCLYIFRGKRSLLDHFHLPSMEAVNPNSGRWPWTGCPPLTSSDKTPALFYLLGAQGGLH